jgi:hypothetical protein
LAPNSYAENLDIPYCFVKGKARLGQLVHQKNAAVVALTEVRKEDEGDLNNLSKRFQNQLQRQPEDLEKKLEVSREVLNLKQIRQSSKEKKKKKQFNKNQ